MAGEGLIWSGIGQGIANAGSTMGQYLMRSQEREADRTWREQQAQDQRDFRAEQNSLYKRTAEEQNAGRASAGKADAFKPEDTQPGGRLAGTAAGMLETNEDRLADYQKYRKTGEIDLEKYGQEVPNRGEENVVAGSKEVPQALKEEFKLKAKMLSQLEESYYLKGSYDDATKGRATAWKTAMGQAAFDKPEVAGKAGQAVAVGEGKPLQNIEGGQQYNQYTGTGATTPLGKAQIGKENAQAGEATKKGDAAETKAERQEKDKRETTKDLERKVENNLAILHENLGVNKNEANAALDSLKKRAVTDAKAAERLKNLQPFIDDVNTARQELKKWQAKPTSTDSGGGAPKPARNKVFNPKTGNFE